MPRYYFNIIENGVLLSDYEGVEFETDGDVRTEAMRLLPEIAKEELPRDGDRQNFVVEVRNEEGQDVYTATLTFEGLWTRLADSKRSQF